MRKRRNKATYTITPGDPVKFRAYQDSVKYTIENQRVSYSAVGARLPELYTAPNQYREPYLTNTNLYFYKQ